MEFGQKSKKTLWISVAVGALILLGAGWYFVRVRPVRQRAAEVAQQVSRRLEEQERTREAAQTVVSPPVLPVENIAPPSNPVKQKVPEVNPVERSNPFSEVFINPFQ